MKPVDHAASFAPEDFVPRRSAVGPSGRNVSEIIADLLAALQDQ